MDFGDQEDHEEEEEEMGLPQSYDSVVLPNSSSRPKMSNSGGGGGDGDQVGGAAVVTTSSSKPRYRECMKNHAVGIGGHALDGCGDFMPAGAEGTPDALKCAACNCHRNFHRKDTASESATPLPTQQPLRLLGAGGEIFFHHHHHHHHVPQFTPYYRTSAGYLHVAAAGPGGPPPLHRALALPSTSRIKEDQEDMSNPSGGGGGGGGDGSSRKRFRTKFTAEQKERMLGLAERLGWRIQKHDETVVQEFCNETGVRRHVIKVWMHNNKHTLGKKP